MVTLSLGPAAIPLLLIAAAIFILGIVVVARERANAVSLSFLTLTSSVSLWLAPISFMLMATTEPVAFALARTSYVGVALIPAAVLQFTMALLGVTRQHPRALVAAWGAGAVFVGLFTSTRFMLSGTWRYSWGFYPRLTEASVLFLAYFALLLAGSLVMLSMARVVSEREQQRNMSFFFALSIGYLGCVDYLPAFGLDIYPFGCFAILGFIVFAAYTIIRHRLNDFSPAFVAERLLQTMHGGVIVVDTRGRIRLANDVAARLLGWTAPEMQEFDLPALLGIARLPVTDSESFNRRSVTRDRIMQWRRRDGVPIELSVSASAVRDEENNPLGILYSMTDTSATHDPLTTLPNRVRFVSGFEEAKDRMIAVGRVPAVFFIDLDGFKAVNDNNGHAAGDALLRMVSMRIRNSMRGDDVLARYAGDEFVVLADLARREDATFVAAKLLRVISEPYTIGEKRVTIGASIGCAFYPGDGLTAEALMEASDGAMYGAKRAGKGRIEIRAPRIDVPAAPPYGVDARA